MGALVEKFLFPIFHWAWHIVHWLDLPTRNLQCTVHIEDGRPFWRFLHPKQRHLLCKVYLICIPLAVYYKIDILPYIHVRQNICCSVYDMFYISVAGNHLCVTKGMCYYQRHVLSKPWWIVLQINISAQVNYSRTALACIIIIIYPIEKRIKLRSVWLKSRSEGLIIFPVATLCNLMPIINNNRRALAVFLLWKDMCSKIPWLSTCNAQSAWSN